MNEIMNLSLTYTHNSPRHTLTGHTLARESTKDTLAVSFCLSTLGTSSADLSDFHMNALESVQHERGPRNSTLRQQVAIYLQERVKQQNHHQQPQQSVDLGKPDEQLTQQKSWTAKRHCNNSNSLTNSSLTESLNSPYYGFVNGRVGEVNPCDLFLQGETNNLRMNPSSDWASTFGSGNFFSSLGHPFGLGMFGSFGNLMGDPKCRTLGSDPFRGLSNLIQTHKVNDEPDPMCHSTNSMTSSQLPGLTEPHNFGPLTLQERVMKNEIPFNPSVTITSDPIGATITNASTWTKALEFAQFHFPQLFPINRTAATPSTNTNSGEEGTLKSSVLPSFPSGVTGHHNNGAPNSSLFNPCTTSIGPGASATGGGTKLSSDSDIWANSSSQFSTLYFHSYLTRLMEMGLNHTPGFGWSELFPFKSFLPPVPSSVPARSISPRRAVHSYPNQTIDSNTTITRAMDPKLSVNSPELNGSIESPE
ncbi:hypothetical protein FBUS_03863, partial [Fasciolopsis buskii]